MLDPDQGLRDGVCQRHHVLQGEGRHLRRGQRGRLQRVSSATGRHDAQVCFSVPSLSCLLWSDNLRNVLGTRNLGDILSEREAIAQEMQVMIIGEI